jgi:hypothetical protein
MVATAATCGISPTMLSPSDVVIELGVWNVVVVLLVVVALDVFEDDIEDLLRVVYSLVTADNL